MANFNILWHLKADFGNFRPLIAFMGSTYIASMGACPMLFYILTLETGTVCSLEESEVGHTSTIDNFPPAAILLLLRRRCTHFQCVVNTAVYSPTLIQLLQCCLTFDTLQFSSAWATAWARSHNKLRNLEDAASVSVAHSYVKSC